jgi:5-methylcytosine-specific restriction endonuclease McrA
MTLKEAIYEKHHKSSAFALIRTRARAEGKKLGFTKCCKCGYDKHIEVAHIKPISSFSEEVMISIINSKENIMPLCPNCHWEYDHNLWT